MALYGAVPPFEDPEIPIDYCCRGLGQPEVRSDLQSLPHVFGAAPGHTMIAEDRSMGAAHSLLAPRDQLELGKMCKDQNRWKSRFEVIFVYMDLGKL